MKKRSITLAGHKTSIALEGEFWQALEQIAIQNSVSLPSLIAHIDANRQSTNLTSSLRVFALRHFQNKNNSNQPAIAPKDL